MILCDTNILIEAYKNNPDIVRNIKHIGQNNLIISDVTCIELFYGSKNKRELQTICKDLSNWNLYPINPEISTIAVGLIRTYCLSHHLDLPDALIAATAIHYNLEFYTLNVKHFVYIPGIRLYHPG
jgi:predicted nucleic acid-binding protein